MTVLALLASFILFGLIYGFLKFLNSRTKKRFNFEFFSEKNLVPYVFINLGIYFGYHWFSHALEKHGDTLNGIVIMVLAGGLFIYVLVKNIKEQTIYMGFYTLLQFIVFIPGSIFGIAVILGMVGYSVQARPVYNLD